MEEESSLSGFQGENYRHFKQLIDPRVGKYNLEMWQILKAALEVLISNIDPI